MERNELKSANLVSLREHASFLYLVSQKSERRLLLQAKILTDISDFVPLFIMETVKNKLLTFKLKQAHLIFPCGGAITFHQAGIFFICFVLFVWLFFFRR